MATLVGLLVPGAIAGESEIDKKLAKEAPLFERIKLRGALRDDVLRDVIEQAPGEGYQPRVVQWWPKKGVDYLEEPKIEHCNWTIRPESIAAKEPKMPKLIIPEKCDTVVPSAEDTAIRESDLAAFKKAMEKE